MKEYIDFILELTGCLEPVYGHGTIDDESVKRAINIMEENNSMFYSFNQERYDSGKEITLADRGLLEIFIHIIVQRDNDYHISDNAYEISDNGSDIMDKCYLENEKRLVYLVRDWVRIYEYFFGGDEILSKWIDYVRSEAQVFASREIASSVLRWIHSESSKELYDDKSLERMCKDMVKEAEEVNDRYLIAYEGAKSSDWLKAACADEPLPDELNTDEARQLFAKAIEVGLMEGRGNVYKWLTTKSLLAYFADRASEYLNLSSVVHGDSYATAWKPFEVLFGENNLRSCKAEWRSRSGQKPKGTEVVDKLFDEWI